MNCFLEIIKEKNPALEVIESLRGTYEKKGLASRMDLHIKLRNLVIPVGVNLQNFLQEFNKTLVKLKVAGGKMEDDEIIIQIF